jgi:hypothetical protein
MAWAHLYISRLKFVVKLLRLCEYKAFYFRQFSVCEFVAHKTFHIWLLPKYNTNSVMSLTVDIT